MGIYNNLVRDWGFSGIRVGDKISEVFTTAYVDVSQNLVVGKPVNLSVAGDSAGLYWNTHWFGPGEWGAEERGGEERSRGEGRGEGEQGGQGRQGKALMC